MTDHAVECLIFLEAADEYEARCICGWSTTAWASDAAEESLQFHIDTQPDGEIE